MRFFVRRHVGNTTDRAIVAGSAKVGTIIGITIIVGVAAGAAAIGLGLGLGFGLTNNPSVATTPLLSPPIVNCDPSARCGCQTVRPVFTPRIINGQQAAINSWPWMVYLTMNNSRICSGFLISSRHVLTAASCFAGVGLNITINIGINNFQSTFGGFNATNSTPLSAVSVGDIGIVTLGTNVSFTSAIQPCCLSGSSVLPAVGTPGVIAGWGETSIASIGTPARTLQQAVVQVRNPSVCGIQTGNDTLCASFGSISTCPIDTGGPLMVEINNRWTCVGIIDDRTPGCTNPIAFTRISSYMPLIQNISSEIIPNTL